MNFAVTILGSNSALPAHGRHPTAQVVTFHDRLYLLDCGEGTQLRLSENKIRRSKIRHIFISHLHGDHYFGLIGMLNSFGLQNRQQPLHIFGPGALEQIIRVQLDAALTRLPFPWQFTALREGVSQVLLTEEDLIVHAFPVDHQIPCFGFLFEEVHRKRKLDPLKAQHYHIPPSFYPQLQEGEDYVDEQGNRVSNDKVTSPGSAGRRYAFCADTRYDERLLDYVRGADLIYHETTYLQEDAERARLRYHSTSVEAATLARQAGARKLLIGHFSSKYEWVEPFLDECRPVFAPTELACEGATYLV